MIVTVDVSDAFILTEIALKSKSFWGYSNELIESWRNDLTVTSTMISNSYTFKFLVDDCIVGFYLLNPPKEQVYRVRDVICFTRIYWKRNWKKIIATFI